MDQALARIVDQFPKFRASVSPPLTAEVSECLAAYWVIIAASNSIDPPSASQISGRILSVVAAQPWSAWKGNEAGMKAALRELCDVMMVGKRALIAAGAETEDAEVQRTLFIMNVSKAAIASSNYDDTRESSVMRVMDGLAEFHPAILPLVQSAGTPLPVVPARAEQPTGCLIIVVAGAIGVLGAAFAAQAIIS